MKIIGDTALIQTRGVLARYADSVNDISQPSGRSAESIQADLLTAADAGCNRVVMKFDTPGGEVHGVEQTAKLMRQLSANGIQIIGFVDGKALSGGMWLLSACDVIVCSGETDLLGSVGVALPMLTESKDKNSVTWIKSAPAKGVGPVTPEMKSNAEQIVNDLASCFYSSVIAGFGLDETKAAKVCNAEIFTAKVGVELGIVDHICSLSSVLDKTYENQSSQGNVPRALAGDKPAQTADNPAATTQEVSVKPTGDQLAALIAANTKHSAMIVAQYNAGADLDTIKAQVTAEVIKDATAATTVAQSALAAEQTEHGKTKAELAKITAEFTALKALANGGQKDPKDGGHVENGGQTMTAEAFDKMPIADQKKFLDAKGRVL